MKDIVVFSSHTIDNNCIEVVKTKNQLKLLLEKKKIIKDTFSTNQIILDGTLK